MELQPQTSLFGCLVRIFWVLLGPALLILAGVRIVMKDLPPGSSLDLFFVVVLGAMVLARRMDSGPREDAGKIGGQLDPGRTSPWKYMVGVALIGGAWYGAVHFLIR